MDNKKTYIRLVSKVPLTFFTLRIHTPTPFCHISDKLTFVVQQKVNLIKHSIKGNTQNRVKKGGNKASLYQ